VYVCRKLENDLPEIMTAKTAAKKSGYILPDKWKGYANEDSLIDAWMDGKEAGRKEGRDERTRELIESFHENLRKTFKFSEELYAFIVNDLGAKCAVNKVKPEAFNTFESIFAVEQEAYLKKDFRKRVYAKARELSVTGASEQIHLDFIITSSTPEMNRTVLITNGYWYEYRPAASNKG
jgi:Fe-S-cluster containining protein